VLDDRRDAAEDIISSGCSAERSDRCSDEETMTQKIKAVAVRVNGNEIELNSFVETLFGNTIVGMVESLRLDQPPERIEVSIEIQSSPKRRLKA
jgi:hypothetical protein